MTAANPVQAVLDDVAVAVMDYQATFGPEYRLSETLQLAVRAAALLEATQEPQTRRWSAIRELVAEHQRTVATLQASVNACTDVSARARTAPRDVRDGVRAAVKQIRTATGAPTDPPVLDCSGPGRHAGPRIWLPAFDSVERCEACGHVIGK